MRVLLIGKSSGRLDCLAEAISRSRRVELFILTNLDNPSLRQKGFVSIGPTENPKFVVTYANAIRTDRGVTTIAIIANEEPLAAGVADALQSIGIPAVGPVKAAAQIETSKIFTRTLLAKYDLKFSPAWAAFTLANSNGMESYIKSMNTLGFEVVIKPDGLTGGKGVRVQGEHLQSTADILHYCTEILASGDHLLIEAKIEGQEFSRMAFTDGERMVPLPAVQDHKRLGEGDHGVNTGGMGSYSDVNHSLPFLTTQDLSAADRLNRNVIAAIAEETGEPYRGILYGNFIATRDGVQLIEYNARFGDPEGINVLPLLRTDFVDLCEAIVTNNLVTARVGFTHKATVCKYLLPIGYPFNPSPGRIDTTDVIADPDLRVYYGAVDDHTLTGSRALAVLGIGDDIASAEAIAERAARQVRGPLYHRQDIGTSELIQQKVAHMRQLRADDRHIEEALNSVAGVDYRSTVDSDFPHRQ